MEDLKYGFDKEEIKNERKEKIEKEKKIIKNIIMGEPIQKPKNQPKIFELEEDSDSLDEKGIINEAPKNNKLKKDSSKFNKLLKKLGVGDEVKEKPKFEIDQ